MSDGSTYSKGAPGSASNGQMNIIVVSTAEEDEGQEEAGHELARQMRPGAGGGSFVDASSAASHTIDISGVPYVDDTGAEAETDQLAPLTRRSTQRSRSMIGGGGAGSRYGAGGGGGGDGDGTASAREGSHRKKGINSTLQQSQANMATLKRRPWWVCVPCVRGAKRRAQRCRTRDWHPRSVPRHTTTNQDHLRVDLLHF
jgi:hypothetical protein